MCYLATDMAPRAALACQSTSADKPFPSRNAIAPLPVNSPGALQHRSQQPSSQRFDSHTFISEPRAADYCFRGTSLRRSLLLLSRPGLSTIPVPQSVVDPRFGS